MKEGQVNNPISRLSKNQIILGGFPEGRKPAMRISLRAIYLVAVLTCPSHGALSGPAPNPRAVPPEAPVGFRLVGTDRISLYVQFHLQPGDPLQGALVFENHGGPVQLESIEINSRESCRLKFYKMANSAWVGDGLWLTDEQFDKWRNKGLTATAPTLLQGDQLTTLALSLIPPLAVAWGLPPPDCGQRLVHLEADTDAGVVDWDFDAKSGGGNDSEAE
jgi:hypothetical protein